MSKLFLFSGTIFVYVLYIRYFCLYYLLEKGENTDKACLYIFTRKDKMFDLILEKQHSQITDSPFLH